MVIFFNLHVLLNILNYNNFLYSGSVGPEDGGEEREGGHDTRRAGPDHGHHQEAHQGS